MRGGDPLSRQKLGARDAALRRVTRRPRAPPPRSPRPAMSIPSELLLSTSKWTHKHVDFFHVQLQFTSEVNVLGEDDFPATRIPAGTPLATLMHDLHNLPSPNLSRVEQLDALRFKPEYREFMRALSRLRQQKPVAIEAPQAPRPARQVTLGVSYTIADSSSGTEYEPESDPDDGLSDEPASKRVKRAVSSTPSSDPEPQSQGSTESNFSTNPTQQGLHAKSEIFTANALHAFLDLVLDVYTEHYEAKAIARSWNVDL